MLVDMTPDSLNWSDTMLKSLGIFLTLAALVALLSACSDTSPLPTEANPAPSPNDYDEATPADLTPRPSGPSAAPNTTTGPRATTSRAASRYDRRQRDDQPSRYDRRQRDDQPSRYDRRQRDDQPSRYDRRQRDDQPSRYDRRQRDDQPSRYDRRQRDDQPSRYDRRQRDDQPSRYDRHRRDANRQSDAGPSNG